MCHDRGGLQDSRPVVSQDQAFRVWVPLSQAEDAAFSELSESFQKEMMPQLAEADARLTP